MRLFLQSKRTVLTLGVLVLVGTMPLSKANTTDPFWSQLESLLNTACTATGTFNFGGNWEWVCSLKNIYKNARWIVENFNDWARDIAINTILGSLEGTMQSIGLHLGGVNNFMTELEQHMRTVRNAPMKLRAAIAKAMLEDAKAKYGSGASNRYPAGSLMGEFEKDVGQVSLQVALSRASEFFRKVQDAVSKANQAVQAADVADQAATTKDTVDDMNKLATKINLPREVEQSTGGTIKKGVADDLVDRAKSAASTREVSEIIVESIATLLKLQASYSVANTNQLGTLLQQNMVNNSTLNALYAQIAEQYEREADAAEESLVLAYQEIRGIGDEAATEIDGLIDTTMQFLSVPDNIEDTIF